MASVSRAVQTINDKPDATVKALVNEFHLEVAETDVDRAAKYIVHAILNAAQTSDAVVAHVYTRVPRYKAPAAVATPQYNMTIAPFGAQVSVPEAEPDAPLATPVVMADAVSAVRNRAPSAFVSAVALLDDNKTLARSAQIELLKTNGIKESSAVVYIWRYNKGERS
jgi:hypothetical protein